MKKKFRKVVGVVLGLTLVLAMITSKAVLIDQSVKGNLQVEKGNFVVKIIGQNLPKYTFWDNTYSKTKYSIQFVQVFEAEDGTKDGTIGEYDGSDRKVPGSNLALAALSWKFSQVLNDSDGDTHFNMTSSNDVIQFNNHLYANENKSMKFDVLIKDYDFFSNESLLVFGFKITETRDSTDKPASTTREENIVKFADGYFQIVDTANTTNDIIDVGLSTRSEDGNSIIFIAYENFEGHNLTHDPMFGIDRSTTIESSVSSQNEKEGVDTGHNNTVEEQNLWRQDFTILETYSTTLVASIVSIGIPVILHRKRA